jgi:phosphatidylinositol alpha-1,6-mannosyltransferase
MADRAAQPRRRVLVVTNDFPPRRGGIESFVASLCERLPASQVVVYTARMRDCEAVDDTLPYPVVRDRSRMLLPTWRVARAVCRVARRYGCDRVVFGASAPLGLLAPALRRAGVTRLVGLTHGHEVWWARVPPTRLLLRRIGRSCDVLTYVSDYCRGEVARAVGPAAAARMVRLSPGVDRRLFAPSPDAAGLRTRLGLAPTRPLVVAPSRLVRRKGHDVLVRAFASVVSAHPTAALVIVGDGPMRGRLVRSVHRLGLDGYVFVLPGVPRHEMPAVYAGAQVFVLPCRTRLFGLEPEALGIVVLEAAATGLPVVVGRSGGAVETVRDGVTGSIVDPRSARDIADRICNLLDRPDLAVAWGLAGRSFVGSAFDPDRAVEVLTAALQLDVD